MSPLPTVESASAMLQQEEAQKDLLKSSVSTEQPILAMYSKGNSGKVYQCTACGGQGHTKERCWTVIGYPKWHLKNPVNVGTSTFRAGNNDTQFNKSKWSSKPSTPTFKSANLAQVPETDAPPILFTPQQLTQIAQLMQISQITSETEETLDTPFSGMMTCNKSSAAPEDWIIDSGASDHMTPHLSNLESPAVFNTSICINMPTGATAKITHTGTTTLPNGLSLHNVLCVPFFRHNLLSVQKLIKNNHCEVSFHPTFCTITDRLSQKLIAVGEAKQGLYYLVRTTDP